MYSPVGAAGARSFRVLPLDFVPPAGSYWLHVAGDSTLQRGEKEDLVLLLSNDSSAVTRAQRIVCLWPWANRSRASLEACGSPRAIGNAKTGDAVNLLSWRLPHGGVLHVSYHAATGMAGTNPQYGRCNASDLHARVPVPGRHGSLWLACNASRGVGAAEWLALGSQGEAFTGRPQPDAIVLNFALHAVGDPSLCGEGVERYHQLWSFLLASVRSVYAGLLVWHTGFLTHFDDVQAQGAVQHKQEAGYPASARRIASSWKCRTTDRLHLLADAIRPLMRRHGVETVDGLEISAPWPEATRDNRHFDGGKRNFMRQGVSIAALNEVLNLLSRAATQNRSGASSHYLENYLENTHRLNEIQSA
uniref:Uncharacterized protein n=1 Tax=Calcidiscus leptoporus TaxID=127549 RepID=A0A7S0JC13_9EUKA